MGARAGGTKGQEVQTKRSKNVRVECPDHLVPTSITKTGGMLPSFGRTEGIVRFEHTTSKPDRSPLAIECDSLFHELCQNSSICGGPKWHFYVTHLTTAAF